MKIMVLTVALFLAGCVFHDHNPHASTAEEHWEGESATNGRMHHYNHI